MTKTILYSIILLFIVAACQSTVPSGPPTDIPFPTMTVGQRISGDLNTPGARTGIVPAQFGGNDTSLTNRTTPTPDTGRCPFPSDSAALGEFPASRVEAINAIMQFLNDGGTVQRLQEEILREWDAFGETGYIETVDLTGEGTVEIILGYIAPGDVGTVLVFGCQAGRYVQLFETISDGIEPPSILAMEDINNRAPAEFVLTRRFCADPEACDIQTQIVAWEYTVGRFVNLLPDTVLTLDTPELRDIDNDQVDELVITLDSNGTAATGPLRQGNNIYDWNGQFYVLSRIQLQPPTYTIQVIHEGDRLFSLEEVSGAIAAYQSALTGTDLRFWFNDGPINTITYGQYRLIIAYGFLGDSGNIVSNLQTMNSEYTLADGETLADLPVYVHMANVFVDSLSQTGDLHEACVAVQDVIEERDEALGFINRYGSRNPQYTALDLCPY